MHTTDITFKDKRSARTQLAQLGKLKNFPVDNRPLAGRLKLYEKMVSSEIVLRSAINTCIDSVVQGLGKAIHPDPEIQEFLNNNLARMDDESGQDWRTLLTAAEFVRVWAGFSVSESVYDIKFGELRLDTLLTYHPTGIIIRPNKAGRLIENQPTDTPGKLSGIYQNDYDGVTEERQLSLWKMLYTATNPEHARYYGRSSVAACYKWHRLKEVFIDILVAALGKVGERMLWVRMQSYQTNEVRVNPATGRNEPISSMQMIKEQFERSEGIPSFLLLPYQQADLKPEVGSVSLSDQLLGEFILKCIELANQEMVRELVPYFLIDDKGNNINASQTEKRMDVYLASINRRRVPLESAFIKKSLSPLVEWNFNRDSAKIPPSLGRVYSERASDWVATMQMVKGLTDQGYLNPTNPTDWEMVRQMVRVAERVLEPKDLKFIRDIFINPRAKTAEPSSAGKASSKDDSDKNVRDREPEGVAANGQGTKGKNNPGRPTGAVTPLFNARPAQRAK